MAEEFDIRLLGRPACRAAPTAGVFPSKGFQLLALLAASPGRSLPRKEAAAMLWDSDNDAAALQNFRQLLAGMKRAYPDFETLLSANRLDIALGPAASGIDLVVFDSLAATENEASLDQALTIYGGELLAGVSDTTQAFSMWLLQERSRLKEDYFAAFARYLSQATRHGNARADHLRRIGAQAAALEPERETTYRQLIEAFGRIGLAADVERNYRILLTMVKREYGAAPSTESQAAYQRALVKPSPVIANLAPAPVVAGRSGWPRVAILLPDAPPGSPVFAVAKALFYDVAHALSQHRTFIVLAAHSSFAVSHDGGLPDDNRMLRADFTLSGLWKPVGSGTGLMIRLVECQASSIVWSLDVSLDAADLPKSFTTLTGMVVRNVAAEMERAVGRWEGRFRTAPAYAAYLAGCSQLLASDLPSIRRARRAFGQALEVDQRSGLAASRLAQTYLLEWMLRHGSEPELLLQAKLDVEASLRLDEGNALGHCILGAVNLHRLDYDRALGSLSEAENLAPSDADIIVQHADALSHCGEFDLAWHKFNAAVEINPLPPDSYWWTGASIAFDRSDYQTVIAMCERPGDKGFVYSLLAATHALVGNRQEAAICYNQSVEWSGLGENWRKDWSNPDKPGTKASESGERFREGLKLAQEFGGRKYGKA